MNEKVKSKTH